MATSDGTQYEAFFFSKDGVKSGGIARIDLTGTEATVTDGLKKPVGVLVLGGEQSVLGRHLELDVRPGLGRATAAETLG